MRASPPLMGGGTLPVRSTLLWRSVCVWCLTCIQTCSVDGVCPHCTGKGCNVVLVLVKVLVCVSVCMCYFPQLNICNTHTAISLYVLTYVHILCWLSTSVRDFGKNFFLLMLCMPDSDSARRKWQLDLVMEYLMRVWFAGAPPGRLVPMWQAHLN